MKQLVHKSLGLLVLTTILLSSCKKDEPSGNSGTPAPSAKTVKYEITGNYSGKLTIVYTNASGATENISYVSVPWSMEFTAGGTVQAVAFTGNTTSSATLGVSGQTVEAKLYTGGVLRQSTTATADANGGINIGSLSHVF